MEKTWKELGNQAHFLFFLEPVGTVPADFKIQCQAFKQKVQTSLGSHFLGLVGFKKWGDFIVGFSSQVILMDTLISMRNSNG